MKVKVAQLCPTLCNPMDYTVYGIIHARIPEWVAIPFSWGSSQPRNRTGVSCIAVDSLPAVLSDSPWNHKELDTSWGLTLILLII